MFRRKAKVVKPKLRPPSPSTSSSSSDEKQKNAQVSPKKTSPSGILSAEVMYGMVDAPHRKQSFQEAPRSIVSGGAESSYNCSPHDPSFADSLVSGLTEPVFEVPTKPPKEIKALPRAIPSQRPQRKPNMNSPRMSAAPAKATALAPVVKTGPTASSSQASGTQMTLNPTSSNFNPLFPSRSLPLNLSELTMELARLPTRDLIAKGQGFFVQIGDPDSRGRREVKTWMEIDEYNTSSSVVMRSLSDFELLQEQLYVENPGGLIPNLQTRLDRGGDVGDHLETWLFDILTGCRREGYYVTDSVSIAKSNSIEAFLFDKRTSFSSTILSLNREIELKAKEGLEKIKSTSAYKDLLTSMTNVGCLSPTVSRNQDYGGGGEPDRTNLAVAIFGCTSHQNPIIEPSPAPNIGSGEHEVNQGLLGAFFKQKVEMSRVLEVIEARIPMEEERGARWKLFAVSLTTLADLERQWDNLSFPSIDNFVQAANDSKKAANDQTFKSCENALYLLARQKVDMFLPLATLRSLTRGFYDDLLMIGPAAVTYEKARTAYEKSGKKREYAGWKKAMSNKAETERAEALARDRYTKTGATLLEGLRELAFQNQISYSRLSYIYYSELATNAKRLGGTAKEVIKKVNTLKMTDSTHAPNSPRMLSSLREDNVKEAKLIREILAFSRQVTRSQQEELMGASYTKRWSNKNVGKLLALATGEDLEGGGSWAEGSVGSVPDAEQAGLATSPSDLKGIEEFVKSLRSTALQCVEAISNLTKEVVVEGVPFDVEKTRAHFNRTFCRMLATEENSNPALPGYTWGEHDKGGCFAIAMEIMNQRNVNEKELLKEVLSGLTSFLSFLEAINCYVNMEKFAVRIEADWRRRRNKALEDLEEKAKLQALIQQETKRRNREAVLQLKARLSDIGPEATPSLLKTSKEKHKASKLLKTKVLKLSKRRLKKLRTMKHVKLVDVVRLWAKQSAKQSEEELKTLEALVDKIKLRHA